MNNNDLLTQFQKQLNTLAPKDADFKVALSGGLDSVVLLHLFSRFVNKSVSAHHVHHGLSENADHWATFCLTLSEKLNINCDVTKVVLDKSSRTSLEALAREKRYNALQATLTDTSYLVTAHHQDDQLETVLLALKRGAGVTGLQGIVAKQGLDKGHLIRPLLNISREQLESYAQYFELTWIEDESNCDQRFDRNFIRHSITPLLKKRWPAIAKTVSRSALHCQTQQVIIDELSEADFQTCVSEMLVLSIDSLKQLSKARRDNVLRYWFKESGLNYPTTQQLSVIYSDVLSAQVDASPNIQLQGRSIQRYRGLLYLVDEKKSITDNEKIIWQGEKNLYIASAQLSLSIIATQPFLKANHVVEICFRGQLATRFKCQPVGRDKSRSIKKLLHEYNVPPWQRDSIAFVFINGILLEAVGVWQCDTEYSESLHITIV